MIIYLLNLLILKTRFFLITTWINKFFLISSQVSLFIIIQFLIIQEKIIFLIARKFWIENIQIGEFLTFVLETRSILSRWLISILIVIKMLRLELIIIKLLIKLIRRRVFFISQLINIKKSNLPTLGIFYVVIFFYGNFQNLFGVMVMVLFLFLMDYICF